MNAALSRLLTHRRVMDNRCYFLHTLLQEPSSAVHGMASIHAHQWSVHRFDDGPQPDRKRAHEVKVAIESRNSWAAFLMSRVANRNNASYTLSRFFRSQSPPSATSSLARFKPSLTALQSADAMSILPEDTDAQCKLKLPSNSLSLSVGEVYHEQLSCLLCNTNTQALTWMHFDLPQKYGLSGWVAALHTMPANHCMVFADSKVLYRLRDILKRTAAG